MAGMIGPISSLINNDLYTQNNTANAAQTVPASQTEEKPRVIENTGEATEKKAGRRSSPAECETCKHRKYQDGSDENVSFKTASHVSPTAAASAVRGHEQEHVSNAYTKAAQNNGRVLSAVVAIHTAVCPECGRTYVSGGTTTTKIAYSNDQSGYGKAINSANEINNSGKNVDYKG